MYLKSKKQSVRLRNGEKSRIRGIWGVAGASTVQAGRSRTGKLPRKYVGIFKRLGLQLDFGFHVASEGLCVLDDFRLIKSSQAVHFPDRPCEMEYN